MYNMPHKEEDFGRLPIVGDLRSGASPRQKRTEKEEKWLREVKSYEFLNVESPGIPVDFTYGDTKNSMKFHIEHGQVVRLPRHIAQHMESLGRPIYEMDDSKLRAKDGQQGVAYNMKKLIGRAPRFMLREKFS